MLLPAKELITKQYDLDQKPIIKLMYQPQKTVKEEISWA